MEICYDVIVPKAFPGSSRGRVGLQEDDSWGGGAAEVVCTEAELGNSIQLRWNACIAQGHSTWVGDRHRVSTWRSLSSLPDFEMFAKACT